MKAKSHYLLDFCVLLTLFYLCNSCVDLTAYYDSGDNKFKLCARKPNGESYENYGFVLGSQLDCESAKAHVKSVGNLYLDPNYQDIIEKDKEEKETNKGPVIKLDQKAVAESDKKIKKRKSGGCC